jgi:SAM-dependent methyltransferase
MAKMSREDIAERLRGEDLDEWLRLWREEQGPAKPAALELMAAAVPPPGARGEAEAELRVLDLGCGPGDAGRAVAARFPKAWVDFVDRDLFFISLCAAVNERDGVRGRTLARDLLDRDWRRDLADGYDVVVAANSLHWMSCCAAVAAFCLWSRWEWGLHLRQHSIRGSVRRRASIGKRTG